jgi:hypothetical protein
VLDHGSEMQKAPSRFPATRKRPQPNGLGPLSEEHREDHNQPGCRGKRPRDVSFPIVDQGPADQSGRSAGRRACAPSPGLGPACRQRTADVAIAELLDLGPVGVLAVGAGVAWDLRHRSELVRYGGVGWVLPVLDLLPVLAPADAVGALTVLRDDALQLHAAGGVE